MSKIPTAEEFTKKLLTEIANCRGIRVQSAVVEEHFIEFAKLHVEAALEAANKNGVIVCGKKQKKKIVYNVMVEDVKNL